MNPDWHWKCAACGDIRPDHLIGVATSYGVAGASPGFPGVNFQVNQKYCLDRPECYQGAKQIADEMARTVG